MIHETYKGRKIKIVKGRGSEFGYTRVTVNGADMGRHLGDENSALRWVHGTVDHADQVGMGNGRYGAEWYEPGTYELNEAGHVVTPGGICSCDYCGSKPWASCRNIIAGGVCICDHCMKQYL